MKRLFLLGFVAMIMTVSGFSQNFGSIYEKSIEDNAPIPYSFLREADVIWSQKIWRQIDLREKMNHLLYYPLSERPDGRKNLMSIILGELKAGNLNAYDPYNLNVNITYSDIEVQLGGGADTTQIPDMNGVMRDTILVNDPKPEEVFQLLLLEEWYFDKKHSRMDVRIIGINPIRVYFNDQLGRMSKTQLFWIRYEDFRDALSRAEVFNKSNDAQRISFDDLFMQRRFASTIYGESNVYDDRRIGAYQIGKSALFEAERIKNEMLNFEHDLWEY